ncbi:MAG: GspE/PulE family protein [Patescibacteria group bacterium]|mgnify:CR=1 FL=1
MQSLLDVLVAQNTITLDDASAIRNEARVSGADPEEILVRRGVAKERILEAKSALLGIPARHVTEKTIEFDTLKFIPKDTATQYKFVPLALSDDGILEVGMVNPEDIEAREALQFISSGTNRAFRIYLISQSDFESVIKNYGGLSGEVEEALSVMQADEQKKESEMEIKATREDAIEQIKEDAPITKTVQVIIRHAIEGRASDIHIEPGKEKLRVRFRVDGVLYTSILLPMRVHEAVISRIKIMSNLKIDEKRKPQDGRFKVSLDGNDIDFRVSTFPTYYGEKVAIRILDPSRGVNDLENLGYTGKNLQLIQEGLKRPFGMVLITGPTGSGKSTTLYAMLQIINDEGRNIVSLEDPIEYYIEGLNQSQVRPEIDYSFASGLRSVLRQDPDVIMVGEIRDKETAQLAIHAALTGHLVLSTLHTNDSVGVIPRLIDMGVDPYLIAPTLVLAIAQRLTRTLCPDSRTEIPVTGKLKEQLEAEYEVFPDHLKKKVKIPDTIYEAKPSPTCPKGTRGRLAITEVLSMTPELEEIIAKGATEATISREAKRQGMIVLRQDGLVKVFKGEIGLESLSEVAL